MVDSDYDPFPFKLAYHQKSEIACIQDAAIRVLIDITDGCSGSN